MPRLTQCLRSNPTVMPLFAHLLHAADRRVREIGRDVLLAEMAARLTGFDVTAVQVCPARKNRARQGISWKTRFSFAGVVGGAALKLYG